MSSDFLDDPISVAYFDWQKEFERAKQKAKDLGIITCDNDIYEPVWGKYNYLVSRLDILRKSRYNKPHGNRGKDKMTKATTLYHGSRTLFPVGFILTPQPNGYVHQEIELEKVVEQHRPADRISRFESVFMVDDPELIDAAGGYEDHIYIVEPIGPIEKSDLAWYTEASTFDPEHESGKEQARLCCLNYWNTIQYPEEENSLWEYRARSARIIGIH